MMERRPADWNGPEGLFDGVPVPLGEAGLPAVAVVRLEKLRAVADVEPLAAEAIAVDRRTRVEPRDEVARLIRRVALGDVRAQQREMRAVIDVGRDRREVRLGLLGLLDEAHDSVVGVELDDAVLADELRVRLLVDGDR